MKYIDAKRLKCELEKRLKNVRDYMNGAGMKYKGPKYYKAQGKESAYDALLSVIDSLQQEQPMPDSTKLIELWHEDKEMLKEKDFRNDPWRLAYNAFLCGFGRGIAVNKQEQPEVDLEEAAEKYDEAESWRWEAPKYPRREAFKAGAKWQKEQMKKGNPIVMSVEDFQALIDNTIKRAEKEAREQIMKESVEGFVGVHLHDKKADVTVNTGYLPKEMGIRGDSKVRVIIVKEEEE